MDFFTKQFSKQTFLGCYTKYHYSRNRLVIPIYGLMDKWEKRVDEWSTYITYYILYIGTDDVKCGSNQYYYIVG